MQQQPLAGELTIVIPTVGREILRESLKAIFRGNIWPGCLIIVDQGQKRTVANWISELRSFGINAIYIPSNQRGRACGINRGIKSAKTRFLAITDDDCFVDRFWLQNLLEHLRTNPNAIITGRVEPVGNERVTALMTSLKSKIYSRPSLKFDPLCGGNMGVASKVIEKLGLFDEDPRLSAAEDCELSYRALISGVQIIYAPDVLVHHYGWRDQNSRLMQYKNYAKSHGGFYAKYVRKGDFFIVLRILIHHLRAIKTFLRAVITRDAELRLRGRAYLIGLLPGIIVGLRRSKS